MLIENECLKAKFSTKGAELISLKSNHTKQEYIWQAIPEHWSRHAPILFPIVGKLKDDTYTYQGISYQLPQHGFARDVEFQVEEQQPDLIVFLLKSNAHTRLNYPFDFELRVSYQLISQSLKTVYTVSNTEKDQMYFSIGAHPAFNCPMTPEEVRSDYKLIFNTPDQRKTHIIENGLFSGATKPMLDGIEIPLKKSLFDDDALVFKNLKATNVTLASATKKWLKFHYQGFPYLGIWSKSQESPFVCIEPWFGLADNKNHNGDLTQKEGIQRLDGGESFTCDYKVEIH